MSASPAAAPKHRRHSAVLARALSERGRCGCLLTGRPGAPVMGRNTHVIFREFQEVFGSRHTTIRHKESIVCPLTLFSWAQVVNRNPIIVEALAGMACSQQGLAVWKWKDRSSPTSQPQPAARSPPAPPATQSSGSVLAWQKAAAPPPEPARLAQRFAAGTPGLAGEEHTRLVGAPRGRADEQPLSQAFPGERRPLAERGVAQPRLILLRHTRGKLCPPPHRLPAPLKERLLGTPGAPSASALICRSAAPAPSPALPARRPFHFTSGGLGGGFTRSSTSHIPTPAPCQPDPGPWGEHLQPWRIQAAAGRVLLGPPRQARRPGPPRPSDSLHMCLHLHC